MTPDEIHRLVDYLETRAAFPRHVGLRIEKLEPGSALFSLEIADEHLNGAGTVHGGVHATIMDSAMAVALLALGLRASTANMNVTYLAPIVGGKIFCAGEVVHRAGRSAIAEARLRDEAGQLLAVGMASFRVIERDAEEPRKDLTPTNPEAR